MPTQNLYPNAAGDLTQFPTVEPSSINHFQAVDETSADDDTSYIESGTDELTNDYQIVIKENSTITEVQKGKSTSYVNYTHEFTTKPSDSSAFTVTDINNLQIGVKYTGDDNPINQTDLFNIEDWPHNSGDTINSITVTARWKSSGSPTFCFMDCTQVFATVDYTAFVEPAETTGPFKIKAGANVKITSGKLTIK
tara:strand:- start:21 stop:605 length:585 start_codon:yes stop_codon:yes gene_type:complete